VASAVQRLSPTLQDAASLHAGDTTCDREPIQSPNAVQRHGALLVADAATLRISHASVNIGEFIGVTPGDALERSLGDLLGHDAALLLRAAASRPGAEPIALADRPLFASAHAKASHVFVELERWQNDERSLTEAGAMLQALRAAKQEKRLLSGATVAFRRLTGFDRVMVYRFAEDGHGEVVAEDLASGQEAYCGLHYPATDIPIQARRLYLSQRVRSIPDSSYVPVPLVAAAPLPESLDLSGCALRSVSPAHLEYMRNMGTAASLSLSIVVDGGLWGLLVCHHRTPRQVGPRMRALCDLLGQTLSAMVAADEQSAKAGRLVDRQRRLDSIMAGLSSPTGSAEVIDRLLAVGDDVLGLLEVDGAVVTLGARSVAFGATPSRKLKTRLEALLAGQGPDLQARDDLGLSDEHEGVGGAMLVPIVGSPGDGLLLIRGEFARTITWGGDPRKASAAADGPISPRRSFAAWVEEVRGRSKPWQADDFAAARELRQLLDLALARRTEAALAGGLCCDTLTGLATREAVERSIERPAEGWTQGQAVLSVGVDRLAAVNATRGYAAGDALLMEAASRLAFVAEELGAVVGRVGGAQFALVLPASARADALAAGEHARAAFAAPFVLPGGALYATASVGVAYCRRGGEAQPTELLGAADVAMRAAKKAGGNRVAFQPLDDLGDTARSLDIEQGLRGALRAGGAGLSLVFQPLFAATEPSAGPIGFEALLRWRNSELGVVSPGEFVPIADATDIGAALGDWVLDSALDNVRDWMRVHGDRPFYVAVNLSPRQLARSELAASVVEALHRHGVPAERLCVEVTEGAFADAAAELTLERLRAAGVRVAVDDFGTGFSCLSYLCRLPADEVKLDRSLVQGAGAGSAQNGDFLAAVVALARSAGLSVVAEGVETSFHLAAIAAAGVDVAQGFLLGRPLEPADAGALLSKPSPGPRAHCAQPFAFRDIVEGANDIVIVTDAVLDAPGPRIVYANPAFSRLTGYDLADILGKSPRVLQGPGTDATAVGEIRARLREGRDFRGKILNYARSGMPYWLDLRIFPLRDAHGAITHFAAVERDVTHDKRRLDELEELAERDTLTGIANRRRLVRHAEVQLAAPAIADAKRMRDECFAYLDIDWFKRVNDTHGHAAGDAVLAGVADLLAENVRRADLVARIGGEEFGIWMSGIPLAEAQYVAERLRRTVASTAVPTLAGPLSVTCSIGIASVEAGGDAIDRVMRRADEALYRAKRGGRNRVEVAA
jgi:diguanylate cyclase (GGDEF)-like protein/PAS domain S-box-containing protein